MLTVTCIPRPFFQKTHKSLGDKKSHEPDRCLTLRLVGFDLRAHVLFRSAITIL